MSKLKKNILTNWQKTYGPGLIYVDPIGEERECDFCDNIKPLASINCLGNNAICICQNCLQTFADAFNE
jgi:hypothetical protein